MKQKVYFWLACLALLLPLTAAAHENYVLTHNQIDAGMKDWSVNVFSALKDPVNLKMSILIGLAIGLGILLYYFFEKSKPGLLLDWYLKKLEPLGHVVLRVALAASFLFSARTLSYLGPEISVFSLPLGHIIHYALYVLGVLLLLGLYSEFVGWVSLAIIVLATFAYKDYILTYFNYYGEFVALMVFGSRILSLDRVRAGAKKISEKYRDYERAIIRITYGISILYPAISIKLLHPSIIVEIVNQYHLNQFHWLFPHDPLLISLGTGLAQVVLGIFLIIGFETRLSTFVTFVLMSMSVLFFKEAVWPHYILLALALYLMINNGGDFSLDHKIIKNKTA